MLGAKPVANGQRFEDTRKKKLCVREEPKLEVEVIDTPKVCLNKQAEISSSSSEEEDEGCDVVKTGSNSDHDEHQQRPLQHHDNDDSDSESDSSSDDSSSDSDESSSDSDSRSRSDDAGDICAAVVAAAPATAPRDDDHDQKPDLLQPFRAKDHRDDDVTVSFGSWRRPPLNDEKAVVLDRIHCLELEAYTALTRAFHASSEALSWEKAELLTDLRKHLHISNDEHLQVINTTVLNRKGRRFGQPSNF